MASEGGAAEKNATTTTLDEAESKLVGIVDTALACVSHLHGLGMGQSADPVVMEQHLEALTGSISEVHDKVTSAIPRLVKYVPFERSSYGAKKDAEIAEQKVKFAADFLRETLDKLAATKP
mmetsp:Transcript_18122/g.33479  ORF Transcript_18122/g.33479 Transcript_18122/m.33479 type:complete len:121 (-) Transcript_18122:378-740(-)